MSSMSEGKLISREKWYTKLTNGVGYIILFPLLIPVMVAGLLCGIALYILDKKNKGLGH